MSKVDYERGMKMKIHTVCKECSNRLHVLDQSITVLGDLLLKLGHCRYCHGPSDYTRTELIDKITELKAEKKEFIEEVTKLEQRVKSLDK